MVNIGMQQPSNGDNYYNYQQSTTNAADAEASTSMPQKEDILSAFEDVLKKMDLPPDKMRTLRNCDLKKKWDLVCDQRRMHEMKTVTDPSVYLTKLAVYLDKKQFKKKKKLLGGETSTTILKHIEISLRTNSIDWVRQFLSPENDGLRILVEYLSQLQEAYSDVFSTENGPSTSSSTTSYFTAPTGTGSPLERMALNNDLSFGGQSYGGTHKLSSQIPPSPLLSTSHFYYNNNNLNGSPLAGGGGALSNGGGASAQYDDGASTIGSVSTMGGAKSSLFRGASVVSVNGGGASSVVGGKSSTKLSAKHSVGELSAPSVVEDDVHVCVSCLRALMNNKFGLNMVFNNKRAIYCIVRSIRHNSLRTKSLAIDLLSAICMLKDGHELIVDAFNLFKMEYKECFRFQTLFNYFVRPPEFHIDFMTSCMKFINVIVHSTEDKNQRVSLQYEFTCLGLDKFLEHLYQDDIDETLVRHVYSYRENAIDVESLVGEANHRVILLDRVADLEREISAQRERVQEVEADYIARNALLNKRLANLVAEKDGLEKEKSKKDQTIHTLTRDFRDREQKYEKEKAQLESRIQELERTQREIQEGLKIAQRNSAQISKAAQNTPSSSNASTPTGVPSTAGVGAGKTAAAPPPPAPPPPPPNLFGGRAPAHVGGGPPPPPPPPPPLPLFGKSGGGPPPPPPLLRSWNAKQPMLSTEPVTIKKVAVTKCKLPLFNWSSLNPNQVKGTVFNDLNDEKLVDVLDLSFLEDMFRIGNATVDAAGNEMTSSTSTTATTNSVEQSQASPGSSTISAGVATANGKTSLLGTKRLQNVAITRRKLAKPVAEIMSAVHRFDLSVLPQENVDILLPIVPTTEEIQQYREYLAKNNNSMDGLTPEDQFLAQLMNIERLTQKLHIMSFLAGFEESYNLLVPQIQKVTAASKSIREATSFHKVIEVILAVGNAMNGARRAPVYGFKLSSLDSLIILKSQKDRSITMMHVIAEIVATKTPELLNVIEQLKFAEGAAGVNMETISADVKEIEAKHTKALAEQERKGGVDACPRVLHDFLEMVGPKLTLLREGLKLAQDAFVECAEYYGESPRSAQADAFFTRIASFVKHFEQALNENESRRSAEQRQIADQERKMARQTRRRAVASGENSQEKLVDELNAKFMQSLSGSGGENSLARVNNSPAGAKKGAKLDSSQINDGDFERIMNGLKDGYVALDSPVPIPTRRRGGVGKSPSPHRPSRTSNASASSAGTAATAGTNSLGVTRVVQRDRA